MARSTTIVVLLVALVLAAAASAFQIGGGAAVCNGVGHPLQRGQRRSRSGVATLVASAVTGFEQQEAQGFVQPPPPPVATLIARVQGKVDGDAPVMFEETLKAMEACYDYTPRRFFNGDLESAEGTNAGSAKLLSLGILHGLDVATLLKLFGEHYRSVLKTPKGTDHGNIRNLMTKGWNGVKFPDGLALAVKK